MSGQKKAARRALTLAFNKAAIAIIATFQSGCGQESSLGIETCKTDHSKSGFELAKEYDDCAVHAAQISMADIEAANIEVRATEVTEAQFGASNARLDAEENWIQAYFSFVPAEQTSAPSAPSKINGVILAKMKSKESIDAAFGLRSEGEQGICAEVQQSIYHNALSMLTGAQRREYEERGIRLKFIPDDDAPPLTDHTNPTSTGSACMATDPASKVVAGDGFYTYEPMSAYVESNDPNLSGDMDEGLRGVRYCKLLTHQLLLDWMLAKSFEDKPALLTATKSEVCEEPASFTSASGSCFFYFTPAQTYYCSDYTGVGWDKESARQKCAQRASNDTLVTAYSESPCDQRQDEIESHIDGYVGFAGACIVNCKEEHEFIWNIYQDDAAERCSVYPFISPEEKKAEQD